MRDRDRVMEVVRAAAGEGRLTPDELDERLKAALSSRTLGELAALTADLIAHPGPPGVAMAQAGDVMPDRPAREVWSGAPAVGRFRGGWSCGRRGAT